MRWSSGQTLRLDIPHASRLTPGTKRVHRELAPPPLSARCAAGIVTTLSLPIPYHAVSLLARARNTPRPWRD